MRLVARARPWPPNNVETAQAQFLWLLEDGESNNPWVWFKYPKIDDKNVIGQGHTVRPETINSVNID